MRAQQVVGDCILSSPASHHQHWIIISYLLVQLLRVMKEQGNSLQQVEVGQDVTLICNYQMMGDSLYSIKWYRDDKEFYRYIPNGKNYTLTRSA